MKWIFTDKVVTKSYSYGWNSVGEEGTPLCLFDNPKEERTKEFFL